MSWWDGRYFWDTIEGLTKDIIYIDKRKDLWIYWQKDICVPT